MVEICLPLERNTGESEYTSKSAPNLWRVLSMYIDDEFKALEDRVDKDNDRTIRGCIYHSWSSACRKRVEEINLSFLKKRDFGMCRSVRGCRWAWK